MNAWTKRLGSLEVWHRKPPTIGLSLRGTPFAEASRDLGRLHDAMLPFAADLLVFNTSDLPTADNPMINRFQEHYLNSFSSRSS